MNRKLKKLWQLVMLLAVDLVLLVFISSNCFSQASAVRIGCNGERVAAIQRALSENGFFTGEINGEFGISTLRAVKKFQKSAGENADGEADHRTLNALGISSRTSEAFTAETELLARCIQQSGCHGYAELLGKAKEILNKTKAARTLGSYVCEYYPDAVFAGEPSSEAYAAALQAIRER